MDSRYHYRQGPPPSTSSYYDSPYVYNSFNLTPSLLIAYLAISAYVIYGLLGTVIDIPPLTSLVIRVVRCMLPRSQHARFETIFGSGLERLRQGGGRLYQGFGNTPAGTFSGGGWHGIDEVDGGRVGGLYNGGNTCYQNSVLQAMASVGCFPRHLAAIQHHPYEGNSTPAGTLMDLLDQLNTTDMRSRTMTVPRNLQLNSAGAWFHEQQDAQEFFQKLTGELETEATKTWVGRTHSMLRGLESITDALSAKKYEDFAKGSEDMRSPFEGLLAQRVGCLGCGYVEAIRMSGFTSMSLALPSHYACTVEQCLDEYTSLETLNAVPCEKCTLLSVQKQIAHHLEASNISGDLREQFHTRLELIVDALSANDFSPETLKACRIRRETLVISDKTKQIMLARLPQVLVMHMNRSVFDMMSGGTRKNYATVHFDPILDLEPWTVGDETGFGLDPARPMRTRRRRTLGEVVDGENTLYRLKSVVVHFGSHGSGHYISYRQTLSTIKDGGDGEPVWWRCNDSNVRPCTLQEVLGAGNAFMMFYEKVSDEECFVLRRGEAERQKMIAMEEMFEDALETPLPVGPRQWSDEWSGDDGESDDDGYDSPMEMPVVLGPGQSLTSHARDTRDPDLCLPESDEKVTAIPDASAGRDMPGTASVAEKAGVEETSKVETSVTEISAVKRPSPPPKSHSTQPSTTARTHNPIRPISNTEVVDLSVYISSLRLEDHQDEEEPRPVVLEKTHHNIVSV